MAQSIRDFRKELQDEMLAQYDTSGNYAQGEQLLQQNGIPINAATRHLAGTGTGIYNSTIGSIVDAAQNPTRENLIPALLAGITMRGTTRSKSNVKRPTENRARVQANDAANASKLEQGTNLANLKPAPRVPSQGGSNLSEHIPPAGMGKPQSPVSKGELQNYGQPQLDQLRTKIPDSKGQLNFDSLLKDPRAQAMTPNSNTDFVRVQQPVDRTMELPFREFGTQVTGSPRPNRMSPDMYTSVNQPINMQPNVVPTAGDMVRQPNLARPNARGTTPPTVDADFSYVGGSGAPAVVNAPRPNRMTPEMFNEVRQNSMNGVPSAVAGSDSPVGMPSAPRVASAAPAGAGNLTQPASGNLKKWLGYGAGGVTVLGILDSIFNKSKPLPGDVNNGNDIKSLEVPADIGKADVGRNGEDIVTNASGVALTRDSADINHSPITSDNMNDGEAILYDGPDDELNRTMSEYLGKHDPRIKDVNVEAQPADPEFTQVMDNTSPQQQEQMLAYAQQTGQQDVVDKILAYYREKDAMNKQMYESYLASKQPKQKNLLQSIGDAMYRVSKEGMRTNMDPLQRDLMQEQLTQLEGAPDRAMLEKAMATQDMSMLEKVMAAQMGKAMSPYEQVKMQREQYELDALKSGQLSPEKAAEVAERQARAANYGADTELKQQTIKSANANREIEAKLKEVNLKLKTATEQGKFHDARILKYIADKLNNGQPLTQQEEKVLSLAKSNNGSLPNPNE